MKRSHNNPNPQGAWDSPRESRGFRRQLLRVIGVVGFFGMTVAWADSKEGETERVGEGATGGRLELGYVLRAENSALLDEMERRAVLFFTEHTDAVTGLTRDRAPNNGASTRAPSSVAATGFALTAWCIGEQRGWLRAGEARRRVVQTLRFVAAEHAQERGWLYHFVDATNGQRVWKSEASTIDTALFLQGALLAREYLDDAEVTELVNKIYGRIDWRWALDGGSTLSHGWKPESGFIVHRWDNYSELMGLYLLGIGAKEGALPAETWQAWRREPWVSVEGSGRQGTGDGGPRRGDGRQVTGDGGLRTGDGRQGTGGRGREMGGGRAFIQCGPLFTHQYAHAWFDFRGRRDAYADYWQNSVEATLAQREWSAAQSGRYPFWSRDMWGLTASDSARGYVAWGTPMSRTDDLSDGTLVPCAPGGSLPFAPGECLTALRKMKEIGGASVWGRYGFSDAFNPQTGWVAPDVIGINVGITLVMAENLRSGLVWKNFMRAPEVRRGLRLAGFSEPVRWTEGRLAGNP